MPTLCIRSRSLVTDSNLYGRTVRGVSPPVTLVVPPCPVCDATSAHTRFEVEDVPAPVVVCDDCGLGYYHPMPNRETVASFYPDVYYGEPGTKFRPVVERIVRMVGRRHVRFLARDLPHGASILDVGCGRGVLLGPLADMGFCAHGVEASEAAVRGAPPSAEIRIAPTLRDAGYAPESFDEVILWHVLEHLPDPRETLDECFRVMKPHAKIVVALPNFSSFQARWSGEDWFHLDPPRHLFHFHEKALWRLLERTGFTCESVHHFSLRQNPFGWIQSAMNRWSSERNNALYKRMHAGGSLNHALSTWALLLATALPALGLSVVMAVLRSGATVHIVAHRKPPSEHVGDHPLKKPVPRA